MSIQKLSFYSFSDPTLPAPRSYPEGPIWIGGVEYWNDGTNFQPGISVGQFLDTANTDSGFRLPKITYYDGIITFVGVML